MRGSAGNDSHHICDGFKQDTLTETAFVKAGKKKLPGGTDTLGYSVVSIGNVVLFSVPQWDGQVTNQVNVVGSSPPP